MTLTFGQAKLLLARYAGPGGLCADDPEVDLFVKEVLQNLINKGPDSALRTFTFQIQSGLITIPYELQTPLKVKIDGRVGNVWSQWYRYYESAELKGDCHPAADAMVQIAGDFPTVYDPLVCGEQIGVLGHCKEDCDAHLIVKGFDATGREIYTDHKGEQISGEYLSIEKDRIHYTSTKFARISHIVKSRTKGYVTLLSINNCGDSSTRRFLSDYSPMEEVPQYRRYRFTIACRDGAFANVLGRIRLKENYADSDPIPIESISALKVAAQGVQLEENNDFQGVVAKDQRVNVLMTEENMHKKVSPGQPIDVFRGNSPGQIMNIVRSSFGYSRRWPWQR